MDQKSVGSFLRVAFVLVLGLLCLGLSTEAQVISGDLVGTIFDKSGAVVPHASVEAVNAQTGVKRVTEAGDSGEYRFNNLPVGSYNVTASAPNFASTSMNGFQIELNKTSTLSITLEVKGAATQIEVSGTAAALDTTTAQLSTTFEQEAAAVLPTATSGSGVLNLSLLSSGVASSGGVGAGAGPSVGGQRPRNNNFTVEGVDNNDKSVTGPLVNIPNDAVAEFSLLQNNFAAEFGHSSGGQFNTVVKSGTNSFHGLAYVYNQNRNYFALDTQQKVQNGLTEVPRYDNNRYGGNVGGPILKNKLFFFVNFEYQPIGQTGTAAASCAPTQAGLQTIENYTPAAGDRPISQTNLSVFEQYVPVGTITNVGCAPVFLGNNSATQTEVETAGLAFPAPSFSNTKNLVTSGDWNISSKDQLRARYIWNDFEGLDTAASLPVFFTSLPAKYYLFTLNEYHTFTPSLQNEFRLGFNRYYAVYTAGGLTFPAAPGASGPDAFPNLTYDDLGFLQIGPDPNAPQGTIQNTYQLVEAVSWTKGRHSMKFGVEGRKVISPQFFIQRSRGDYEYGSLYEYLTDDQPTSFAERSTGTSPYYGDQSSVYFFAQDNWRVRNNLTLNFGLRYEYTTIPFTQRLQALNSIASVPGLVNFTEPRAAKNDWAPRFGFAYSPGKSGKTSIRGGAGIAYDVLYDNLGILSGPPQVTVTYDCGFTFDCTSFDPTVPQYVNGFLAGGGLPSQSPSFSDQPTAAAHTSAYVPVDQKSPKSIDWTLGVQHQFLNDYTVEVRYVGTRGIHLPSQIRLNRTPQVTSSVFLPTYTTAPDQATLDALPYTLAGISAGAYGNGDSFVPAWEAGNFTGTNVVAFEPWSSSTYHGLATQLTKKFSYGLQFVGSYTFSKTIDNATADVFSTVLAPRRAQDWLNLSADRSNSILDHRNRFTLGLLYDVQAFKHSSWAARNLIGNWTIAPIYTYQTGQWATAQSAVDSNLNGDSAGDRPVFNPNGTPGVGSGVAPLLNSSGDTVAYLANNPNAQYIVAGPGALSTTGRSTLKLDAINNWDVTVSKRISLTERYRIEFQVQAFNLFNHAQYVGGYLSDVASIGFTGAERNMLVPNNADFNNPSSVFSSNPRNLQLALKLFF